MAIGARATTFATGSAGFIGTELIEIVTARGRHRLSLLASHA
jgi:hypothetical protein